MEISELFLYEIRKALREGYPEERVRELMDTAEYEEDETGVTVAYADESKDRFVKVTTLMHELELI